MPALADQLRADLTAALRAKEKATVRVLRTVLGAVANAEAVPVESGRTPLPEGAIAGAVSGLGAAEAPRRVLTDDDVRRLVAAERDDLLATAEQLDGPAPDRAAELRASAVLLERYR